MATFFLRARQKVALGLEPTFAFFAEASNLQRLTPPLLDFTITSPLPIAMGEGTVIDYRLKVRGIPLRWRSVIREWRPPHHFVDEQVRGPYSMWRHVHRFTADGEGTLVEDDVRYRVPGGRLANLVVRRDLLRIFRYRQVALLEALGVSEIAPGTVSVGTVNAEASERP